MATMIPDDIEQFTTDGERQVYQFLSTVAKPDSRFISWYTPDIDGKEPDFIMFYDEVGLVVFEVKDWTLRQIRDANPNVFNLEIGGDITQRENPLHQARGYFLRLMEKIEADGKLLSDDPMFHGKSKVPINCGVIFTNINKLEYEEKGLGKVIGSDKIFFWNDLSAYSDFHNDTSGNKFRAILKEKFPPLFKFTFSPIDLQNLRDLLFPEVRVELPERDLGAIKQQKRILQLDHNQESLARKYDGGHRILKGASGSGKTLVLIHKADFLLRYNPAIKKILFVCFNITLVNYIKRLLADKRVPLGESGVVVCHFYELC